jgi:glyoxylase-like metal-dependent hydrolase (beta-lactamase superfamily II)
MHVHHLNAGTLCPVSARLVNGRGRLFERARLVCHVLLLETHDGLVLVDTGLGVDDIAHPHRLGERWLRNAAPRLLLAETALEQVKALGFSATDVRHILLTHLDRDHAGGIADFPLAKVHLHVREHQAAITGELPVRKGRYLASQWNASSQWVLYGEAGEDWFGFQGVRALDERNPDVLVIPLPGHTPGHCGVAVRTPDKWLLHAGDSYFFHGQIQTPPLPTPLALGLFQRRADTDQALRVANQERLRVLHAQHGTEVSIFNSHDPQEYDGCCVQAGNTT